MKEILQTTLKQIVPILTAAGIAGAIAIGQSLATSAGFCPGQPASVEAASTLGAFFKGAHSLTKAYFSWIG